MWWILLCNHHGDQDIQYCHHHRHIPHALCSDHASKGNHCSDFYHRQIVLPIVELHLPGPVSSCLASFMWCYVYEVLKHNSIFLLLHNIPLMYILKCIHLYLDGLLRCFEFSGIMNSVLNILVNVFWCTYVYSSSRYRSRGGISRSQMFSLQCVRVPVAAHPCQHLVLSKPFWCVYVIISLYNLLIALLCVSLMANDFRNPFNTFSGHLDILFCKGLVKTH